MDSNTIKKIVSEAGRLRVGQKTSVLFGVMPVEADDFNFKLYKSVPCMYIVKKKERRYSFMFHMEFEQGKRMVYNICKLFGYIPFQRFFKGPKGELVLKEEDLMFILHQVSSYMDGFCGGEYLIKDLSFSQDKMTDKARIMSLDYEINRTENTIFDIEQNSQRLPYLKEKLKELKNARPVDSVK